MEGNTPTVPRIPPYSLWCLRNDSPNFELSLTVGSISCHFNGQTSSHEVKSISTLQARTFPGIPRWQRGSLTGG